MLKLIISLSLLALGVSARFVSTGERVLDHGYPLEEHIVQTGDGYRLKMFRIPYSPILNNQNDTNKPIVFLMHGLLSSSDSWVLNGPDNAIAFMMCNAGYDVWMGNARGNVYSRDHVSKPAILPSFWNFDWHEIGLIDLPAMIDYVLFTTQQDSLHYVGHSQGTTVFMVLLSTLTEYNEKIKTSHLLAPVGFMDNMEHPLAKIGRPFVGNPSLLAEFLGNSEFMPSNSLIHLLGPELCKEESSLISMCENIFFLVGGWNSSHMNLTLLESALETHPAGCSTQQLIHYLQEYDSGYFRYYDYGYIKNLFEYQSLNPPNYNVKNIQPATPVHFYFSDNDYFVAVKDVLRLSKLMGKNVVLHHVTFEDYNHVDFLWAENIKEVINDCVLDFVNEYENRPLRANSCQYLKPY